MATTPDNKEHSLTQGVREPHISPETGSTGEITGAPRTSVTDGKTPSSSGQASGQALSGGGSEPRTFEPGSGETPRERTSAEGVTDGDDFDAASPAVKRATDGEDRAPTASPD
jgi:hypothetical protein